MGQFPGASYPTTELEIHSGDRLVLYTDGVTEATAPTSEFFGTGGRVTVLADSAERPAESFAAQLLEALHTWTGRAAAFEDDVSLVVLDILHPPRSASDGAVDP